MTLRVAVNLLWLAPGRVGGSEEYLTRQLAGLPGDADVAVHLYVTREFPAAHRSLTERVAAVTTAPFRRDRRGSRIIAEHTWLAARTRDADLVHHGGGTAPLVGPRPIVLTVHDLQYRTHPSYFSSARRAYLRTMVPRSVRRAAVVAVPSEYVRASVVDSFGTDPDRVVVVPHGVPDLAVPGPDRLAAVRARWGLADRPYVVYPAITHPHKRHGVLVESLADLPHEMLIVLVGGAGAHEEAVRTAVGQSPWGERVIRTGRVSDADRDALVAGASVLAFPSEYEGFGAPLVEAMQLGVPIVCSDRAAIPGVVGDAAVVVAAGDGPTWAAAIGEAIDRRDELVAAGHRRRRAFTLEASGRALADAYRRATA